MEFRDGEYSRRWSENRAVSRRLLLWLGSLLAAAAVVTAVAAGAVEARRRAVAELAARERALQALVAGSRAASREAEELLQAGDYDFAAQVSSRLVGRVLAEFVGYEQETRRGNRFRVLSVEPRFHEGYAEVRARADFDWRYGLYHGPIAVRYLAFSRMSPGGGCHLYFRVAAVQTLAPWPLFNRWLAPFLTLRLQRNLAMPDLALPVGLAAGRVPGSGREFAGERVRVTLAEREWSLGSRQVFALATPERLGLVVGRLPSAGPPPPARPLPATGDVALALRASLLAELLAAAVAPPDDARIAVGRVPRVWARRGRLLRREFDNHVDLARLDGSVDVVGCRLDLRPEGLDLDLDLRARFVAQLEGSLFGVDFDLPLRLRSAVRERVPLRLEPTPGGLAVAIDRDEIAIPLDVETTVRGFPLHFRTTLPVRAAALGGALRLPDLVATRIALPRRVERGEVRATKTLVARFDGAVELPAALDRHLVVAGDVVLDAPEPAGAQLPRAGAQLPR
jgi:hypothetical protein